MKNDRQTMILEIISQENIETQEQLLARLQERGITSTQATIWASGRQRLSKRAVSPLLEAVMMADAPMSLAVVQAAWATAALTDRRLSSEAK